MTTLSVGFATFVCAMGIAVGMIVYQGVESFTFLYQKWVGFVTASLLLSIIQSVYVYLASFQPGKLLSLGGNTGNPIYDVWYILLISASLIFTNG